MALYLDSALADEARQAAGLGFVAGATTNPALIARDGRRFSGRRCAGSANTPEGLQ